jgi:hypothetical protein
VLPWSPPPTVFSNPAPARPQGCLIVKPTGEMDKPDLARGCVERVTYDFADAATGAARQQAYWATLEKTFTALSVTVGEAFLKSCYPATVYPPVGGFWGGERGTFFRGTSSDDESHTLPPI